MKRAVAVLLPLFAGLFLVQSLSAETCANAFCLEGNAHFTLASVKGPESWIGDGWGPLTIGGETPGNPVTETAGELRMGVLWKPAPWFQAVVRGTGRDYSAAYERTTFGVTEGYVEARTDAASLHSFRVRAGMFFLPTSREAVDPLWTTPYTLTLSALNSWIGEEVRPIGLDGEYRGEFAAGKLRLGATAFRGNDTMGALLGWRGWSMGNWIATYGEVMPLPNLPSLQDPRAFALQRDDGTVPVERDLDGRTGWSGRARFETGPVLVQYNHVDNRGDRELHDGEYAWQTRYDLAGAEVRLGSQALLIGEYMRGVTGMGSTARWAWVDARFESAYLLLTAKQGPLRGTVRYDTFETTDLDGSPAESQDQNGNAWTAALLVDLGAGFSGGVEFLDLNGTRPRLKNDGTTVPMDSQSISAELRYSF